MLELSRNDFDNSAEISFTGELTREYIQELTDILTECFGNKEQGFSLTLNLEKVTKVDTCCLQLICRAHRISLKMNDALKLVGLSHIIVNESVKCHENIKTPTCELLGEEGCVWYVSDFMEKPEPIRSIESETPSFDECKENVAVFLDNVVEEIEGTLVSGLSKEQMEYLDNLKKSAYSIKKQIEKT